MITFGFSDTSFGGVAINNKVAPTKGHYKSAFDNFIIWKIKGVNGAVLTPQPHANLDWSYMTSNSQQHTPYLLDGKCTHAHAKMILEFISGRKWQSRIKKAYSARNRWNGKPI